MSEAVPPWLTAVTIIAPIFASFGVLWLSNRQQTKNLKAQYDLSLEKDRIAATIVKAEELYADIQLRKKHIEGISFQHCNWFVHSKNKQEFLEKISIEDRPIDFDLVRMELNIVAYFPDLEKDYRSAEKLIHKGGDCFAKMIADFDVPKVQKQQLNGIYVSSVFESVNALDGISRKLAGRINDLAKASRS